MPSINNGQNIIRVFPKMSDEFHDENNAKLSDCVNSLSFFDNPKNFIEEQISVEDSPNEHMYTAGAESNEVSSSDADCQSVESEVKSLKDWLLLHNDLIQQQNDDILEKERQIFLLQKENQMLKERLNCLEKGIPYEYDNVFTDKVKEDASLDTVSEDMTQDSGPCEEDCKENIDIVDLQHCDNVVTCSLEVTNSQENHTSDIESQIDTTIDEDNFTPESTELKREDYLINDLSDSLKTESDNAECNNSLSEYNFTVNNFCELDPMKNIRMSIRRKRVCSNSSALSNNDPVIVDDKKPFRRFKKKRRRTSKDSIIVTSLEPYITHTNIDIVELQCPEPEILEISSNANLEVPRWRVKHYTSCYTMEGTENLDDEVYNKRHMRLEVDERRRKRWDVQRIREQRVIEKLKLRQERIGSGSRGDERQESLVSLWPKVEDVKFLEITDELPVSAFGHPIPKLPPIDFSIPWLNDPSILTKKLNNKRSTMKRKVSRNRR